MNQGDWVRPLLRCPNCLGELDNCEQGLGCAACQLAYPVLDGVPGLLTGWAETLRC